MNLLLDGSVAEIWMRRTTTLEKTSSAVASHIETVTPNGRATLWAELIGTFFGLGRLKPGPGTWGSAGAMLSWAAIGHWLPNAALMPGAIIYAALATIVGIPAATRVARACGREDPPHVVIDEVAGQMVTLIGAPLNWKALLAGFILFRVFDILKPPPVRQLERLPEGTGIIVDDLGAGVYALIVLQALLHFGVIR
jgi:phosphatidylglycerophosphatase A